ncbi:MAG: aldo/keto reductase [Candidatus Aminicenantes bacterium]|nr:aldo/keto reductase [Candidatus Aminicenantes bacterium]
MRRKTNQGRRNFLKASFLGLIGAGMTAKEDWARTKGGTRIHNQEAQEKPEVKIKDYRLLGRTGFKVSDLATGYIQDEGIMGTMLDAGVNYIDTGESYPGSHQMIGKVIKGRDRKSIFVTSKMLMEGETSKEGLIKRAHKCLQDLATEYIDCMMLHCPETVEALQHEGFHAAMKELKTNGRIHYVGVSNHGSFWFRDPEQTMDKILLAAAEDGRFDVFLFAYNFLKMDQSEKVLEVCKEKKIGTTLMKTTPVFNYYKVKSSVEKTEKEGKEVHPLYKEGLIRFKRNLDKAEQFIKKHNLQNPDEIRAAAIKFALSNPNVNAVCCSIRTYDELDRILSLSGTKLDGADRAILVAYKEGCGELYCRHACGVCEPSCPQGVPVNTIMRYNHYFVAQGREKEAMEKYNKIPGTKADMCSTCSGYCEGACPHNVPIQGMLLLAHEQLSLA